MDRNRAITEIQRVFGLYATITAKDLKLVQALKNGKLYELFVLAELISDLVQRGFGIAFRGTSLRFKASPGRLKLGDSHFEVRCPGSATPDFWIFVDIEFETLGSTHVTVGDRSGRHELDIVVVCRTSGYPRSDEIALGIECKAVANFEKGLLKEVLGVRRELSFFRSPQPSMLTNAGGTRHVDVAANPPSEFWLAFIDPKGRNYADSPSAFGIELRHLEP